MTNFDSIPPRIVVIIIPTFTFLIFLSKTRVLGPLFHSTTLKALTYIQSFRIIMELILWLLIRNEAMPNVMTYTGRNFDIFVGITAPVVGYLCFSQRYISLTMLKIWNYTGIAILAVTVFHGLLSAPTPFRLFFEDVSTALLGTFPYALLPGFVVPFAFACHILSIRKINRGDVT